MKMSEFIYNSGGKLLVNEYGEIMLPRRAIVRCRDCKRFIPQGTHRFEDGVVNKDTCEVIRGFVVQIDPEGFCAWGEWKD